VTKRDVVVIGGSAGGIKAMLTLVGALPRDIPMAMFVVIHSSPAAPGLLPEIFSHAGSLQVQHAEDGVQFEPGVMYVAPVDRHLLVERSGRMRLTLGPRENRFRPAIDPLFRSAALAFGDRVVGILLSGGLDDGVAGLAAIKAASGLAIVQHLQEAEVPTLPRNALRHVDVDHSLPVADIAALLMSIARGEYNGGAGGGKIPAANRKTLEIEVRLAEAKEGFRGDILELGNPSMLTCPECHGTLMRLNDESILRFRCHTGHGYTAASLLGALNERIEDALWNSVRALEESAMLLNHMASHLGARDDAAADTFREAADAALERAKRVRLVIAENEPAPEERHDRAAE
jgi:two-component system, chemotaxis family, protein-glutamate methylesterase/glutaminase